MSMQPEPSAIDKKRIELEQAYEEAKLLINTKLDEFNNSLPTIFDAGLIRLTKSAIENLEKNMVALTQDHEVALLALEKEKQSEKPVSVLSTPASAMTAVPQVPPMPTTLMPSLVTPQATSVQMAVQSNDPDELKRLQDVVRVNNEETLEEARRKAAADAEASNIVMKALDEMQAKKMVSEIALRDVTLLRANYEQSLQDSNQRLEVSNQKIIDRWSKNGKYI